MADVFDEIFGPRKRKRKPVVEALPEAEEPGVIASLGSNALSGLGFVGNVLDTPGAILRNTLVGENPLKGLFKPEQRTSGRDLLEAYGAVDASRPGFHPLDDPGDALSDVAGFGAEVVFDPLTYLTLGASALSKTGKAVKKAGLLGEVTGIASQKAGKEVGKRVSRLTTTAADLFGGDATAAAKALGISEAEAGQKLGGMFNFMGMTGGTGKTAQKIAGGMDAAGEALKFGTIPGTSYSPGQHFNQLFDYRVQGANTKDTQKAAIEATRQFERDVARTDRITHAAADAAKDAGLTDEAGGESIRDMLELGNKAPTPAMQRAVNEMHAENLRGIFENRAAGGKGQLLNDPAGIKYAHRQASEAPGVHFDDSEFSSTGGIAMSGRTKADFGRLEEFQGLHKGTNKLKEIIKDPAVIKFSKDTSIPADTLENFITMKYGSEFVDPKKIKAFAAKLKEIPEPLMEKGLFADHAIVDFSQGARGRVRANANLRTGMKVIEKHAAPLAGKLPADHVLTEAVLDKLGYEKSLFPNLLGTSLPRDEADSLVRVFEGFKTPKAVGKALGSLDSYMNLWKAGVLTRPARYVRDAISGAVQNANEGVFSLRDYFAAHNLMRGKSVESLAEIPIVQQMLKEQGLGPDKASDIVRQLAGAYGVAGNKQAAGNVVGNLQVPTKTGQLDDLLGAQPGRHPISGGEFVDTLRGKTAGASWNPTKVRGFAGAPDTAFPLVKAGEYAGYYSDTMNRLPAFITLLRRGVEPGEAMRRINAAQVNYANRTFTEFERKVMKRIVPFYPFVSRQAPYVAKHLVEHPGGLMAQEIRAAKQANKDKTPLPDKVTQGMAVPLGTQADGTKRFLTSLGLMHEDPLTLLQIGSGVTDTLAKTGRALLGRANPIAKAFVEVPTGKLLFSGQELQSADPSFGRAYSNIRDTITGEKTGDAPGKGDDIPTLLEYGAGLVPGLSSIGNAVRTGFDPRKSATDKVLNLLSGAKVTDVSPRTQEAVLIERVKDKLIKQGGSVMERAYIPKYKREAASPGRYEEADKLLSLIKLHDNRRNKAQAAEKTKNRKLASSAPF